MAAPVRTPTPRIQLRYATPDAWLAPVLADFDAFLVDHAACERKASAMAMHLVSHYRDRQTLIDAMVEFACEELDHFRQVYGLIRARGLVLQRDEKDAYVNRLNALLDRGSHGYFLDRLLVAGIIEARGCERFAILAGALDDPELARFYREIAAAEARHRGLFLDLAREYFDDTRIHARLDRLLDAEAEIVADLPHRAALH